MQADKKENNSMNRQEPEMLADFFRSFGDATRIRILHVLANGEICVGELADELELTQSAVSHQLKLLKGNRLVKARRDGRQIYYSLDDTHVYDILKTGLEHIREGGQTGL